LCCLLNVFKRHTTLHITYVTKWYCKCSQLEFIIVLNHLSLTYGVSSHFTVRNTQLSCNQHSISRSFNKWNDKQVLTSISFWKNDISPSFVMVIVLSAIITITTHWLSLTVLICTQIKITITTHWLSFTVLIFTQIQISIEQ